MVLQDYLREKKKAKRLVDTLLLDFRKAYNLAEETTRDNESLIDLEKLTNETSRNNFKTTLIGDLTKAAREYQKVPQNEVYDLFQQDRLLRGYIGFTGVEIDAIVDQLKEKISFENTFKNLEELIKPVIQNIKATSLTFLSESDANDVIAYTRTQNKVDATKLNKQYMAELINIFENIGIVPDKALIGKPYLVPGFNPQPPASNP